MSVKAAKLSLTGENAIDKGCLFSLTIELDDGESASLLDDKTVKAQVRVTSKISSAEILTFVVSDDGDKTITLTHNDKARLLTAEEGHWTCFVIDADGNPDLYFFGPVEFRDTNTDKDA